MLGIYNVNQIVPFKKGVPMEGFWMATIGGLVYYDKSMSTFQDVIHPEIFGRYVSNIYSGHNGDLWIYVPQSEGVIQFKTTNFYLMYGFFDPQIDFTNVKSIDNDIKSLGSNKINDILFLAADPFNHQKLEYIDEFINISTNDDWILNSRTIKYLNDNQEEEIQKFVFDPN